MFPNYKKGLPVRTGHAAQPLVNLPSVDFEPISV